MRVENRACGQKPVIRDPKHSYAAVVFRHVLYEPFNRVVCIGAFIDGFRIRPLSHRPVHDELALRFEAAANVLKCKDVSVLSQLLEIAEEISWSSRDAIRSAQ